MTDLDLDTCAQVTGGSSTGDPWKFHAEDDWESPVMFAADAFPAN